MEKIQETIILQKAYFKIINGLYCRCKDYYKTKRAWYEL